MPKPKSPLDIEDDARLEAEREWIEQGADEQKYHDDSWPPEHVESEDCWCHPTVEHYEYGDVVIHNDASGAERGPNVA